MIISKATKSILAFILAIFTFVLGSVACINASANTAYYSEYDIVKDGKLDIYDFMSLKNKVLNAKTEYTDFTTADLIIFGNYLVGKEYEKIYVPKEPDKFWESLNTCNTVEIDENGNQSMVVLIDNKGNEKRAVFNVPVCEKTEKMEILKEFNVENVEYYFCLTHEGIYCLAKNENKYNFENAEATVKNITELKRIIDNKDIIRSHYNEICFVDENLQETYVKFSEVICGNEKPENIYFESDLYSVYENEGHICLNLYPRVK